MREEIKTYFQTVKNSLDAVIATYNSTVRYSLDEGVEAVVGLINDRTKDGGKLMFIGNGASAAISSHMAADFSKNAGVKAIAFNDSSLLTCISNDYGYRHVFEKPIEMFAEPKDILVAISSSGKSENILRATIAAKERGLKIVTLSGFDEDNPLRKLGDVNFYVPNGEYGPVEIIHQAIVHCLVDTVISTKNRADSKKERGR